MDNPESVLENETHQHLWDFEIPTDQLISCNWSEMLPVGALDYTNCISSEDKSPHNQCLWYDTKQSDGEVSVIL